MDYIADFLRIVAIILAIVWAILPFLLISRLDKIERNTKRLSDMANQKYQQELEALDKIILHTKWIAEATYRARNLEPPAEDP